MNRRNRWLTVLVLILLAASVMALSPRTAEVIKNLWTFEKGILISGTGMQISGGGLQISSGGLSITGGSLGLTGGGTVSLPIERSIHLPLQAAFIRATGVIGNDGTTAPGLATTDVVPAIVYADSTETASLEWSFRVPRDYSSGLGFRLLCSTSDATTPPTIDWAVGVNVDGVGFVADEYVQTSAQLDANSATSNDVVTLALNATAEAVVSAGRWVTLKAGNHAHVTLTAATLEIKGVEAYYTATQ